MRIHLRPLSHKVDFSSDCLLLVSLRYDKTVTWSLNSNVPFQFIAAEECQQSRESIYTRFGDKIK